MNLDFMSALRKNSVVRIRFANAFLIIALFAATGTDWIVLQSVAWVRMAANYSQNSTLRDTLVKTFDGNHPCNLCKAIAAGKKCEKKPEFPMQSQRVEFPPLNAQFVFVAPEKFQPLLVVNLSAESRALQPPTPPPRVAFL